MSAADSDQRTLQAACSVLAAGGLIAYPTEAVYGLGCDPGNRTALQALLRLKQRQPGKGLILIASDIDQLSPWIRPLDAGLRTSLEATWPGPVTWLVPAAGDCPRLVRGDHDTIAVRVTAHPLAAALCRAWGGALVSTSANRAGEPALRDADSVRAVLADGVDLVVEGPTGGLDAPTPIIDARTGTTVRD